MRHLFSLLAFLLTLLTQPTLARKRPYSHARAVCARKNPAIVRAVEFFCSKADMEIPNPQTAGGTQFGGIHVRVSGGSCAPHTWLPSPYCRKQFWEVCANSREGGLGVRRYGEEGCQWFMIGRSHRLKRGLEGELGEGEFEDVEGERVEVEVEDGARLEM